MRVTHEVQQGAQQSQETQVLAVNITGVQGGSQRPTWTCPSHTLHDGAHPQLHREACDHDSELKQNKNMYGF